MRSSAHGRNASQPISGMLSGRESSQRLLVRLLWQGVILSGWEGAILRAELMKSPEPVVGFHRYAFYHCAEEAAIFFTANLDDRSITNI